MFTIENHEMRRARDVNAAVRYVAADVLMTMWAGRDGLALELEDLVPGQSLELGRVGWAQPRHYGVEIISFADPIVITRNA